MSKLKKEHVAGTGSAAVAGGTAGAAIGGLVAGPFGLAVGAAAGTAMGAIAGHRAAAAVTADEDLEHFEDLFESMPYYVREMTWADYAPAYRYGLQTHRMFGDRPIEESEVDLEPGWSREKGASRLLWSEAQHPAAHAWRALDESEINRVDS